MEAWKRLARLEQPEGFVAIPKSLGRVRVYKGWDDFTYLDLGEITIELGHYEDLRSPKMVEARLENMIKLCVYCLTQARFKKNTEGL